MDSIYLLYASNSNVGSDRKELNRILNISQKMNMICEITGFLYLEDGVFMQYLEGPRKAVFETLGRIKKDPRHHGLRLLATGDITQRYFPNWQMGFVQQRLVPLSEIISLERGAEALEAFDPMDLFVFLSGSNELISARAA